MTSFAIRKSELVSLTGSKCAAELLYLLKNWYEKARRPLKVTQSQLGEKLGYCRDTIRKAANILIDLGVVTRQHNPRDGQSRTWRYNFHPERLSTLFSALNAEKSSLNAEKSSLNAEKSSLEGELSASIYKEYDPLEDPSKLNPSSNPATPETSAEIFPEIPEEENPEKEIPEEEITSLEDKRDLDAEPINPHEDKSSAAAPRPVEAEIVDPFFSKPFNPQDRNKPRLRTNDPWNAEELEAFGKALMEYAVKEPGISIPYAWTRQQIQDAREGFSPWWEEFKAGAALGSTQHKQLDWVDPESGKIYPYFEEAVTQHFQHQGQGQTRMGAAIAAQQALAKPATAAALWSALKMQVERLREDWEKQKALGVQTPYVPPSLSPYLASIEPTKEIAPAPSMPALPSFEEASGNMRRLAQMVKSIKSVPKTAAPKEKPQSSIDILRQWLKDPVLRNEAMRQAMRRDDIEIIFDEEGTPYDLEVYGADW